MIARRGSDWICSVSVAISVSRRSALFTSSGVSVSAESLPIGDRRPPLQRAYGAMRRVGSFGAHRRAATTGIWYPRWKREGVGLLEMRAGCG